MSKKKTLHVPDAPFRPGDKPNFKDLNLPKAGEAEKPDVSVDPGKWWTRRDLNPRPPACKAGDLPG